MNSLRKTSPRIAANSRNETPNSVDVNRTIASKRKRSIRPYLVLAFGLIAFLSMVYIVPPAQSFGESKSGNPLISDLARYPTTVEYVTEDDGRCARVVDKEILCEPNGGYTYTFTLTNTSGRDAQQILLTPAGSSLTLSRRIIDEPLPNGASTTLTIHIGNVQPGEACFFLTLMTADGPCCTIKLCPILPRCCATAKEISLTCNPDGTYTYVFAIVNTGQNKVEHIYLFPPAGVTMTPNYLLLSPPLQPGATFQTPPITISGAQPGSFSFDISLHTQGMRDCCKGEHRTTLPNCGNAACAKGICCARPPDYPGFSSSKVAAVTGWSANEVLFLFDFSAASGFQPNAHNAAVKYNGPSAKPWTKANLGTIFGLTIDHLGNIYVTASSAYKEDSYLPLAGGAGKIYKIANGTGAISTFSTLPNTPDPSITPVTEQYPALGNISFNCAAKQFFVTNEDDGRIYRLDFSGTVASTFDHATGIIATGGSPEPGDAPGFAPLGERLWAVQFHGGRVYYGVWAEDCGNRNALATVKNSIWSVGIDPTTGNFIPGSKRFELELPDLFPENFSDPASDISFSEDGKMLVAERTMITATMPDAHASRVLEFVCNTSSPTTSRWTLSPPIAGRLYRYNVGLTGSDVCKVDSATQPAGAAGGIDYDYDVLATYGVWATGDLLQSPSAPSLRFIYGMQGFQIAGGTVITSPLIDWSGQFLNNKTKLGDIEVTCPEEDIIPYVRQTARLAKNNRGGPPIRAVGKLH